MNEKFNYRPISNFCWTSKYFEKLILKMILEMEEHNVTDLAGHEQHGFKNIKSNAKTGLVVHSVISRVLDDNNFVFMTSVDHMDSSI
jgi:hypothetical protein